VREERQSDATDTVPLMQNLMLHFAASKPTLFFFFPVDVNKGFQNQMTDWWDFTPRKDCVETGASKESFTSICRVNVEIIPSS
jgi:hypothetical protein